MREKIPVLLMVTGSLLLAAGSLTSVVVTSAPARAQVALPATPTAEAPPKVTLDLAPGVEVVSVKPHMKIDAGRAKGSLVVEVTIRNTGTTPQRFIVFANGIERNGQHGGHAVIPRAGTLEPNEVGKANITTTYVAAALPEEVLVEVGPCLFGPGCEGPE